MLDIVKWLLNQTNMYIPTRPWQKVDHMPSIPQGKNKQWSAIEYPALIMAHLCVGKIYRLAMTNIAMENHHV